MEPEFARALSLLSQRVTADLQDQELLEWFSSILSCVDIKYASKTDLMGAEGVFYFIPGQSADRLTILVSPYRSQDDIMTAVLLSMNICTLSYVTSLNRKDGLLSGQSCGF